MADRDAGWVTLRVVVDRADVDAASGDLWDAGVAGIEERPAAGGSVELRGGLPAADAEVAGARVGARWSVEAEVVAADAGLDAWRDHARAWRAGHHVVVVPPWLEPPADVGPDDLVLAIDPGHAFGSASHPTTRACLAALEALVVPGSSVLDVGCGSGVLAVAAARLGAEPVVAVDTDPEAVPATLANAAANAVADVVGPPGSDLGRVEGRFDVVVANIGAATLDALAASLADRTAGDGHLVLSGVLDVQAGPLVERFAGLGLVLDETTADGEWRTMVLRAGSGAEGDR